MTDIAELKSTCFTVDQEFAEIYGGSSAAFYYYPRSRPTKVGGVHLSTEDGGDRRKLVILTASSNMTFPKHLWRLDTTELFVE